MSPEDFEYNKVLFCSWRDRENPGRFFLFLTPILK
jgi:hypothetical protein